MTQPRVFTLEEANALLPRVNALVAQQLDRRQVIEERLLVLAERTGVPPEGVVEKPDDPEDVCDIKWEIISRLHDYQSSWNDLENMGIVLKDARIGLLDFYSRVDGKLVFLCWKYGEEAITHYHDVDQGFSGRKPIEGAVKTRLYN
ncbi:MAG: DUF2203 domain-containing protein [Polyangiales bacterium]